MMVKVDDVEITREKGSLVLRIRKGKSLSGLVPLVGTKTGQGVLSTLMSGDKLGATTFAFALGRLRKRAPRVTLVDGVTANV